MGPCPLQRCNLLLATVCLAFLLGSPAGPSPRSCLASPPPFDGAGAGGGAVATCTTTGGSVTNFSASGGSVASCYAYASGNSSSPPEKPSPSHSGYMSVRTPIRVLVLAVIPLLVDLLPVY